MMAERAEVQSGEPVDGRPRAVTWLDIQRAIGVLDGVSVKVSAWRWRQIHISLLEARQHQITQPHEHETALVDGTCELCGRGPEDTIHV